MEEPTLQKILREKYNIDDRLLAEGRFVGLIGDHGTNLLCLGLGIRCLAIARVVLSGDVIDYELLSLLPLAILSLSYQNLAQKIKIRSQFKPTQVYQLCTSANQAEVWDNFTSTIRDVYMPERGDIWCSPSFQPPALNSDFEQPSDNISQCSSHSKNSYKSFSLLQGFDSRLSESSVSLPAKLPSQADDKNIMLKCSDKSQSMIQFEKFVNDAGAASSGSSNTSFTCPFADITLNVSNNFVEVRDISNTDIDFTEVLQDRNEDGRCCGLFKRVFCCFTNSKR